MSSSTARAPVTKMKASSYKGATRIDYSFYTWITEEGIRNRTATNIMAREWLVSYKSNLCSAMWRQADE